VRERQRKTRWTVCAWKERCVVDRYHHCFNSRYHREVGLFLFVPLIIRAIACKVQCKFWQFFQCLLQLLFAFRTLCFKVQLFHLNHTINRKTYSSTFQC
jgi:hypothetical protein